MAESVAAAARRRPGLGRHLVYSALLPVPITCFIGALITDLAYASAPDMMWLDFSSWLLLAGLVAGAAAGIVAIVEFFRARSGRRGALGMHLLLLLAAWTVEIFNALVHARDGWTAVVPTGLVLSAIAVVLALLAGWFWQTFKYAEAGEAR